MNPYRELPGIRAIQRMDLSRRLDSCFALYPKRSWAVLGSVWLFAVYWSFFH